MAASSFEAVLFSFISVFEFSLKITCLSFQLSLISKLNIAYDRSSSNYHCIKVTIPSEVICFFNY